MYGCFYDEKYLYNIISIQLLCGIILKLSDIFQMFSDLPASAILAGHNANTIQETAMEAEKTAATAFSSGAKFVSNAVESSSKSK